MFKYAYSVIFFFCFIFSNTTIPDTPDIVKQYIQEELAKDAAIKKVDRILQAAWRSFEDNGGKMDTIDKIDILNDLNDLKNIMRDDNNPYIQFSDALLSIHYKTSEETIEKIIKTNHVCLKDVSKFKQLDLKNFLTCLKLSLLAHTNN